MTPPAFAPMTPPAPAPMTPPVMPTSPPPPQPAPRAYETASAVPVAPLSAGKGNFLNTGLGFVLIGVLLIAAQAVAFISPMFFNLQNLGNLFISFIPSAAIGFAAVLSSRAKGPDLSIGSVAGLTSVIVALNAVGSGSLITGLLIALIVGAGIGLINGVCTVYLRIPAVIITTVTGLLSYFIGILITEGQTITPGFPRYDDITGFAFLLLLVTFAIAFLLILFTRLGQPSYKRDKDARPISFMFAYVGSAVIGVLAGFFLMLRLGAGMPGIGTNSELLILFVFAVVYSTRALDNRIAPVLFAMVPAWIWTLLSNGLNLLNVSSFTHYIVTAAITLVFVVLAYVCRYERRRAPFLD
jgi:ribose transport system permease protein